MVKIAYHCSHEQFSPKELLDYSIMAEKAGFEHISCSDHFAPWTESQGHSGNAWCWMGALLATTNMTCGTVCAPSYRYHPCIIAQMAATLDQLFPGRFWLALGSGEYLNEQFTAVHWPVKAVRNEILKESTEIIRSLLDGEQVYRDGHIKVETAKLYTLPSGCIDILGASISIETAKYIGEFTDGLIAVSGPFKQVKKLVESYKNKHEGKKKLILKLDVSYADSRDKAIELGWEQWRQSLLGGSLASELRYPQQFEEASQFITMDKFAEHVLISTKALEVKEVIHQFAKLGFDQVNLHNVNR